MKLNKGAVLRVMEAQGTLLTAKQLRGLLGLKKSQSPKLKAWLRKQVEKGTLVQQGVRFGSAQLLEQVLDEPSEKGQSSRGAKFQRGKVPEGQSPPGALQVQSCCKAGLSATAGVSVL